MLSHVKRLFHPSFIGCSYLDSSFCLPTLVRYSSKKNGSEDDQKFSGGLSEPVKTANQAQRKKGLVSKNLFDDAFSELDKVEFKRVSERKNQKKKITEMKPRQLSIKMAEAAKNVASRAGDNEAQILSELMEKLDTVFVGMEQPRKGRKQTKSEQRRGSKSSESEPQERNEGSVVESLFSEGGRLDMLVPGERAYGGGKQRMKNRGKSLEPNEIDFFKAMEHVQDIPEVDAFRSHTTSTRIKGFKSIDELFETVSPLGVFSKEIKFTSEPSLKTWPKLDKTELHLLTRFEPLNWFDQCIMWTEEGKLWRFPIDNEQGMDKEAAVDFTEHIFLDHHIEHWCPKEGPMKHFMDLVLIGLSKNPYYTVEEKKEFLLWYENYFMQNRALLEEIEIFGPPSQTVAEAN